MHQIVCDKCGKVIRNNNYFSILVEPPVKRVVITESYERLDLCPSCWNAVKQGLGSKIESN